MAVSLNNYPTSNKQSVRTHKRTISSHLNQGEDGKGRDDEQLTLPTHLDKHFIPRKKELKGNDDESQDNRQHTTTTQQQPSCHEF